MTGWEETEPAAPYGAAEPYPYGAAEPHPCGAAAVVLTIERRLERADIAALCDRLRELVAAHPDAEPECLVDVYAEPDVVTVEALARLQLVARRLGARLRLRRASCRLYQLLALTGLDGVIASGPELPLKLLRQPEQREPPGGLEERVESDDPPV